MKIVCRMRGFYFQKYVSSCGSGKEVWVVFGGWLVGWFDRMRRTSCSGMSGNEIFTSIISQTRVYFAKPIAK